MIEYFPFVLSLSKHEFSFFSTLLVNRLPFMSRAEPEINGDESIASRTFCPSDQSTENLRELG